MFDTDFTGQRFNNIYIVDLLSDWESINGVCLGEDDVVLTFDFALFHRLSTQSKPVLYLDRLVDRDKNNEFNESVRLLLKDWYHDKNGEDIFVHGDFEFGSTLETVVLNDIFYFIRIWTCLNTIIKAKYQKIFIFSREQIIKDFFVSSKAEIMPVGNFDVKSDGLYFPISEWLISKNGGGSFFKRLVVSVFNTRHKLVYWMDRFFQDSSKKRLFVHEYHPTKDLIKILQRDSSKHVVLGSTSIGRSLTTAIFRDHVMPYWGSRDDYLVESDMLVSKFLDHNVMRFFIDANQDIGPNLASYISNSISYYLPVALRDLNSIKRYIENLPIDLVVSISSWGLRESLIRLVAKKYGALDFIIINGILCSRFSDEGKGFDFTNSYSDSIKNLFFGSQDNVLALGDPRMDAYISNKAVYVQNLENYFTICIGTSGFNCLDLNSNAAIEFDFLFSVLTAIQGSHKFSHNVRIRILVRSNGYLSQYRNFISWYFPNLDIEFSQGISVRAFLTNASLFITFYSQTLFEASCLGIPVIYFINHREEIQEPFGPESPFPSATDVDGLVLNIENTIKMEIKGKSVGNKVILEHYIGPLDGMNTQRNIAFIDSILPK